MYNLLLISSVVCLIILTYVVFTNLGYGKKKINKEWAFYYYAIGLVAYLTALVVK